jgi:serine protease Do
VWFATAFFEESTCMNTPTSVDLSPFGGGATATGWRRWLAVMGVAAVIGVWAAAHHAPTSAQVRGLPDFTELVEQVGPSVVNIRTTERAAANSRGSQGNNPNEEEMLEFFRRFGIPVPPGMRPGPRNAPPGGSGEPQQRGVGSGFILTADGFVMTNAHVVDGADEVLVTLPDKREFKARIIGADRRTDVAVVKVDATGLPAVKLGDVNRLKVGEWVMAIGSPFGLENTVTAGIVSAKQRDTGDYLPFIQTDVAINPGNSGGPLINMRGEVVGINSQIYSRSGGFMGISFAIPIDEATRVADQLRASGRVTRGRIGVQIDQVTKDVAEAIGLGTARGALVRGVESGAPADRAGVEAGDIILRFDGKPIEKSSDLPRLVGNTKPGTSSTMQVFRRGATRDLQVQVAELEPERSASARPASGREAPAARPSAAVASLGLTVADLTDAQRIELKVRGGVRVDAAVEAAARAGLREGDVIVAVANQEVNSVRDFEAAMGRVDRSKPVAIQFRRGEWAQFALVRPAPNASR